MRRFFAGFRHAGRGIIETAKSERNFKFHIFAAVVVTVLCVVFKVETPYMLAVCVSVFLVLGFELLNTAVEAAVDLVCGETLHPLAKKAKDAAAGAVLAVSLSAVFVGVFTFISVLRRYIN